MVSLLAVAILCCAGAYLVALGAAALIIPAVVSRFLLGFAVSPRAHYLEIAIRLAIGGALIVRAPEMLLASAWLALGWVLVGTTALLLTMPWRWHRQFAARTVPEALRFMKLLGTASGLLGCGLLFSTISSLG